MRSAALSRGAFITRKPPRAARPAWKVADEFRRWLRKLPCAFCRHIGTAGNPIVAAHVDHAGQGTADAKGMSSKVADRHSLPLCDECHKRQHRMGWPAFERGLPGGNGPALAATYWEEFPGRREWERAQAEAGAAR